MGRPNIYGQPPMNPYGLPLINPGIPMPGMPIQPLNPSVTLGNNLLNNNIKPPSSDSNTNGNK